MECKDTMILIGGHVDGGRVSGGGGGVKLTI